MHVKQLVQGTGAQEVQVLQARPHVLLHVEVALPHSLHFKLTWPSAYSSSNQIDFFSSLPT